jgi:hypothetical protein
MCAGYSPPERPALPARTAAAGQSWTSTSVPIGVYGHSCPATLKGISTQPRLWGDP